MSWQRLDRRMIWVDAVQALVSVVPLTVAAWVFGGGIDGGLWPVVAVAGAGVGGAAIDAYRWAVTRYRITDELVERRSGLVVRSYRSVRRDRIRSVDVHARLRHRIGGLRVVSIGAGQQSAAGEATFELDAVSIADAHALRSLLLDRSHGGGGLPEGDRRPSGEPISEPDGGTAGTDDRAPEDDEQVLARFDPRWVVYNVFNVWAYVMALGLSWGAFWLLPAFGLDPAGTIGGLADWEALGVVWMIVAAVLAVTAIGVVGLGVNFFVEYWDFQLARVPGDDGGSVLRTRHGLLTTREVARDEDRTRGVEISEPLVWRWMGMADTTVITTGLNMSALSQPAAVLPRGPIGVARPVAAAVLGSAPDPVGADLAAHPRAALRRRMWWATLTVGAVLAALGPLAAAGVVPLVAIGVGVALWPPALGAAVVAHRALGHAIVGDHLVVRSGLLSRATAVLQRDAVSTVAIRESVLQRRLGLRTVAAMTSAGFGVYEAPDLDREEALAFAVEAAPGLLDPFVEDV